MSCPNCHCPDWTPVASSQPAPSAGFGARLANAVRALFGRGAAGEGRQCLRCGLVYSGRVAHSEDEEEDLIAQRMSRIESQMSGFSSSMAPLDSLPEGDGLHLRPQYEMKCVRCGHFDFIEPKADAACPNCGRVYDKVADAVRQEEANTPKPRSVSL